jgi:type II secretory pathway pseudopilin PulG
MGVIGSSGGGYATVNPTQGNPMGEALQNVENSAFKYNAQRAEKDQLEATRQKALTEAKDKEWKQVVEFSEKNPFIATGIGLDAANRQSLENAKVAAADAYKRQDMVAYENANNSVKALMEVPKSYIALKDDLVKNVLDYNPNSAKEKAKILDQIGSGQMVQTNDANGVPKYTVFSKDDNGNIDKLHFKELTGAQLIKQLTPAKSFNIDGSSGKNGNSLIKTFNDNIGKERKEIVGTGLNAKERTYNPGSEELAEIMAEESVKDKDKLYELFSRTNIDPENESNYNDPENIKTAKSYLKNLLIKTAPDTKGNKPDTSLATLEESKRQHNESNAISRANLKISQAKLEQETNTTTVTDGTDPLTGRPTHTETYKKTTKGNGSKDTTPAPAKSKSKAYSATQENAITAALKKNPGYTRKEIIAALKL